MGWSVGLRDNVIKDDWIRRLFALIVLYCDNRVQGYLFLLLSMFLRVPYAVPGYRESKSALEALLAMSGVR